MKFVKKYYKRTILLLLAIALMAIGAVLFLTASIGSDAILVLNQGVSIFLKIETGTGVIITNLVLLIFVVFTYRKSIGFGTALVAFLLGFSINLFSKINFIETSSNFFINLIIFFCGLIIGSFGVALYIYVDLGLTPFEGIIVMIEEKTKMRFGLIKIINDIVFFAIGYLLGGTVGVGSLILMFLHGPSIDLFLTLLKKSNLIKFESDIDCSDNLDEKTEIS